MLQLRGKCLGHRISSPGRKMFSITKNADLPKPLRRRCAFMSECDAKLPDIDGFAAVVVVGNQAAIPPADSDFAILPDYMNFVGDGDILSISNEGHVWVLFRKSSKYNTFLLTEQCNHLCLMCSQPPKKIDDSWLLKQAMAAIDLIPKGTLRLGYSGGEPTIYGDGLINLVEKCAGLLPNTMIDILTNGRAFSDPSYAKKIAKVNHQNCMICIPVYSSSPEIHDYVVQSKGAFDETIEGILNLKALKQKVELRIVLHKQTIGSLVETCHFITRILGF